MALFAAAVPTIKKQEESEEEESEEEESEEEESEEEESEEEESERMENGGGERTTRAFLFRTL